MKAFIALLLFCSTLLAQTNVTGGLIGWWKLDDSNLSVFIDSSPSNANAAVTGNVLSVPGAVGNGIWFTNATAEADIAGAEVGLPFTYADNLPNMTLTGWVKITNSIGGQREFISKRQENTDGNGWGVYFEGVQMRAMFQSQTNPIPIFSNNRWIEYTIQNTTDMDSWQFWAIALAIDPVTTNYFARCFINNQETHFQIAYGDEFGTHPDGGPPAYTNYSTTNLVRIGKNYRWQQAANGLFLDDLRIYNRTLTPFEITNQLFYWRPSDGSVSVGTLKVGSGGIR